MTGLDVVCSKCERYKNGQCRICLGRRRKRLRKQGYYANRHRTNPEVRAKQRSWHLADKKRNPAKYLIKGAHRRSENKELIFELSEFDIIVPEYCPVLGIKLECNTGSVKFNSPTLDRIDPNKGYTKDNIHVISMKANLIKQDASPEEIQMVATYFKNLNNINNINNING